IRYGRRAKFPILLSSERPKSVPCPSGYKIKSELRQCGAINFRKTHLKKNLAGWNGLSFHHARNLWRGTLHDLQDLVGNCGGGNLARDNDYVFRCVDVTVFGREHFVNLLAESEDVNIHGDFKSLALIGFVP